MLCTQERKTRGGEHVALSRHSCRLPGHKHPCMLPHGMQAQRHQACLPMHTAHPRSLAGGRRLRHVGAPRPHSPAQSCWARCRRSARSGTASACCSAAHAPAPAPTCSHSGDRTLAQATADNRGVAQEGCPGKTQPAGGIGKAGNGWHPPAGQGRPEQRVARKPIISAGVWVGAVQRWRWQARQRLMLQTAARGWHRFMWQPSSLLHSQIGNQLAPGHVLLLSGGHGAPRPSGRRRRRRAGPCYPRRPSQICSRRSCCIQPTRWTECLPGPLTSA